MPLFPSGVSVDLGATPFEVLANDTLAGGNLAAVLGERADYAWTNILDPDRVAPVGSFSATFLDFYDPVDAGDANNPDGGRWRSINVPSTNQFPTINSSDADFDGQRSLTINGPTGGACSIQHTRIFPPPASFTIWLAFKYSRPASNGATRTLFSWNQTGTGAWLYILRPNDTFDQLRFTPDQGAYGSDVNSYQFTPLVDGSAHIVCLSFDGDNKKSELWMDGALLSQFTHTNGPVTEAAQYLNFGNLTSGLSPIPKVAFGALSSFPMARRSGSNLVEPDMIPRLFEGLGELYGISVA